MRNNHLSILHITGDICHRDIAETLQRSMGGSVHTNICTASIVSHIREALFSLKVNGGINSVQVSIVVQHMDC